MDSVTKEAEDVDSYSSSHPRSSSTCSSLTGAPLSQEEWQRLQGDTLKLVELKTNMATQMCVVRQISVIVSN